MNAAERFSFPRLAAAALLAAATLAMAGPGDLDPTFGDGGRVFVDVPNDIDVAATVVLQADGKLVIGRGNDAPDDDFSVLRLNADGSPDTGFASDGRTALDYPGIKGTTQVLLDQSDGSVVAAGRVRNTLGSDDTNFGMARYNSDGSVDTGFGVDGVVIHELGGQDEGIGAIMAQADGRLVAAGYTNGGPGSHRDMAFTRFNTDGSLDLSFGTNGSLVINFHDGNGPDEVGWLIQQPDGKILAVGSAWPSNPSSSSDIGVVRLSPDGIPDSTFDSDGRVAVNLQATSNNWGSYFLEPAAVALQPDGRLLLAGSTGYTVWDYGGCLPALTRLNTDGSLDTTFGGGGAVPIYIDSCAALGELATEPNGDLYFTGGTYYSYTSDLFVARVIPSGDLDTSFGADGVALVDVGNAKGGAALWRGSRDIVRQPDGKIVTVTSASVGDDESPDARLVVARLLAEGEHAGVLGFKSDAWVSADGDGTVGNVRLESETVGVVEFPVRRTSGSSGTVGIDYETASGSAASGVDFTGTAGTLTWADGDRTDKTISVSIADDTEFEEPESFRLILSNPSGGVSLATTDMTFQIQDDDGPLPEPPRPTNPPGSDGGSGASGCEALIALVLLLLRASKMSRATPREFRETECCKLLRSSLSPSCRCEYLHAASSGEGRARRR